MDDYAKLSPETIRKCIETLRYLQDEFRHGFRIDAINMAHADAALARVEAEIMVRSQMRLKQEAGA